MKSKKERRHIVEEAHYCVEYLEQRPRSLQQASGEPGSRSADEMGKLSCVSKAYDNDFWLSSTLRVSAPRR